MTAKNGLDGVDRKLLRLLGADGRASYQGLADEVGEFLAGHVRCELDEERRQQHERAAGRRHANPLQVERLLYVAVF